ncbi:uncharacterized protein LOC144124566 [Amblyomma americanum]
MGILRRRSQCKKDNVTADALFTLENMNGFVALLRPMADATNNVQAQGVTSSLVIVTIVNAYRRIQANEEGFPVLRRELLIQPKARFSSIVHETPLILAAVLHPKIKTRIFNEKFFPEGFLRSMPSLPESLVIQEATRATLSMPTETQGSEESAIMAKCRHSSSVFEFLEYQLGRDNSSQGESQESEVEIYLHDPICEEDALKY